MPKKLSARHAGTFGIGLLSYGVLCLGFATAASAATPDAAMIAHGKYLVTAGDCSACHTAPDGPKFAGGLFMDTPFGKISTPNITPDKATGIGNITDAEFIRVLHRGIGMKGEYLYPVMPYPWYAKVTKADALAIKAYLFSLKPVHAPRKPFHLAFPFNIRTALLGWDLLFLKDGTYKPDAHESAQWNRGAYLVQGLEHCGECHNGRNLLGDTKMAAALRGGPIDNWYAPNITDSKSEGIGGYSNAQIFQYLKTGTAPGMGVVAGPMAQTVHESLSKLTDSDVRDIVLYLKSRPPKADYTPEKPLPGNPSMAVNGEAYLTYCSSCHGQRGQGLHGAVPALAGNGAVKAQGPQDVIHVVLGGLMAQGSYSAMPAIGTRMTDQEVADATNYIRASWGNDAPATAGAGLVGTLRADASSHTVLSMAPIGGCPKIADKAVAAIIAQPATQHILQTTTPETYLTNADALIGKLRAQAPQMSQADIINSLTLGYCPVVAGDAALRTQAEKSERLDGFAVRIYTQLVSGGKD